jgi:hypothetical protein
VNLYGAVWVKLTLTRSQGNIFAMGTPKVSDRRLRWPASRPFAENNRLYSEKIMAAGC